MHPGNEARNQKPYEALNPKPYEAQSPKPYEAQSPNPYEALSPKPYEGLLSSVGRHARYGIGPCSGDGRPRPDSWKGLMRFF